jgi:hypothetical protein
MPKLLRLALPALMLLLTVQPSLSQTTIKWIPLPGGQYGISVASSTALTVPAQSVYAVVCAETAAVRYTTDGTTPTATVGMPLASGQCVAIQGEGSLSLFRVIQQTAGATLDVSYFK